MTVTKELDLSGREFQLSPERLPPGAKILVVSDGSDEDWRLKHGVEPLVSGVKRFTETIVPLLRLDGYQVEFLHPYIQRRGERVFQTAPLPFYPEFELVSDDLCYVYRMIRKRLLRWRPDSVFIATGEGILGFLTTIACASVNERVEGGKLKYAMASTTNFDQHLTELVRSLTSEVVQIDPAVFQPLIRLAYQQAESILVPTPTMQRRLGEIGLERTQLWPRGVDTAVFRPRQPGEANPYQEFDWYQQSPLPILIYFGRVSWDKQVDKFLTITQEDLLNHTDQQFHKVIIGSGPDKDRLESLFGDEFTHFLGPMARDELASYLRFSDVFVFPSVTDTFGNVIVEAGASGVVTVGYKGSSSGVPIGSQDVIADGVNGWRVEYPEPLIKGIVRVLTLDSKHCADYVKENFSWLKATDILLRTLPQNRWLRPGPQV